VEFALDGMEWVSLHTGWYLSIVMGCNRDKFVGSMCIFDSYVEV
jgi:hypothetical protein